MSTLVFTSRFWNTQQGLRFLLVPVIVASLAIMPAQAGRQKKTGERTAPSGQVNQEDPYEEITPTPVSSLLRTSHQLLLPDTACEAGLLSIEGDEIPTFVKPGRTAVTGRNKGPKKSPKKTDAKSSPPKNRATFDNLSGLGKLKQVKVPASAREELDQLISTLVDKDISCKTTFVTMLEKVIAWESASTTLSTRTFLQKADTFFRHMKNDTADYGSSKSDQLSTGSLTALIRLRQKNIFTFTQCSDEQLQEVAQLESLKTLTSLCSHKGFPESLESFRDFEALFGKGEEKIHSKYRQSFTSMHSGKGVPRRELVLNFWCWIKNNQLEAVLPSLSSTLTRRGIPDLKSTRAGSLMPAVKAFVRLFGDGEDQVPLRYLRHFTSMQNGKGVPAKERVLNFWQWIKDNRLQVEFSSLSGLLNRHGIPDPNDTRPGSSMHALEVFVGLFGEEQGLIPRRYLRSFTWMQSGKGVPSKERVLSFWQWIKENNLDAQFSSLSSLLGRQGILESNETKMEITKSALKDFVGLFGDGEGLIPRRWLHSFTSMHSSRGVPAKEQVLNFWGWIKENQLATEMASLSSLLHGRGIPDTSVTEPGSTMKVLRGFVSLFGDGMEQIPRRYLQSFASMHICKGIPTKERVVGFWQWIKDNQLEAELLSLSSLLTGQGIPDLNDTEAGSRMSVLIDFIGLFSEAERQIPRCYLSSFTSMLHGKGISASRIDEIRTLCSWLGDDLPFLSKSMVRLFQKRGLPDLTKLIKYQSQFHQLTGIPLAEKTPYLKMLALHWAAPDQNDTFRDNMENYLLLAGQQERGQRAGVRILAMLLEQHKSAGMEMYRALAQKNTDWDPQGILTLLMEARHLPLARVAINDIWQGREECLPDARQYLFLAEYLEPVPTALQWQEFKELFLPVLAKLILPRRLQNHPCSYAAIPNQTLRFYWESLWKMTAAYQATFQSEENLGALLRGVRSVAALHRLSRCYDTKMFEEQCHRYVDFFSQASDQIPETESAWEEQESWSWTSYLLQGGQSISPQLWQQLEDNRHYLPHFIIQLLACQDRVDMPERLRAYVKGRVRLAELLYRQPVLTESILEELEHRKDELSASQIEDVVTRLDINLPFWKRAKWVDLYYERQQLQVPERARPGH